MLPKIHKPNNPGCPIMSAISCPTAHIASFLDSISTPINQQLPTFIKDTSHDLLLFKEFQFTGSNRLLVTMNVQSLYTCIPHADGLRPFKFFQEQNPKLYPPSNTFIRLAELVLKTNSFTFNGSFYFKLLVLQWGAKLALAMPASSLDIRNILTGTPKMA